MAYRAEAEQVRAVIGLSDQLEQMQAARNALAESGTALGAGLATADAADDAQGGALASPWLPLVFIIVTLLSLAGAAWLQRELANLRRVADQQGAAE